MGEQRVAFMERWDDFDVILAPSYAEATALNRARAASSEGGAFGVVAATFRDWVEGLWERHGDGRRIASETALAAALSEALFAHEGQLTNRPGLGVAVLRMLSTASGQPAFDAALSGGSAALAALLPEERELLQCIAAAKSRLEGARLIEFGDAGAWLASRSPELASAEPQHLALLSDAPLEPLAEHVLSLFEQAGVIRLERLSSEGAPMDCVPPARLERVPEGVSLRFAFPSGDYATPQLVERLLEDLPADGGVVIAAKEPLKLYRSLAPALSERGISVAAKAQLPFAHTAFGRAYGSLRGCLEQETLPWNRALLADAFRSPLLRTSAPRAWAHDLSLRGDRLADRDAAIDDLARESGIFSALRKIIVEPTLDVFHVMEERIAHNSPLERTEVMEALSALQLLEELHADGLRFGIGPDRMSKVFKPLLERAQVRVSLASYDASPGEAPQVTIMSLSQASRLGRGQCASLVALDLDADSYPASERDDALSLLLDKLGVSRGEGLLDRQRRMWARLVRIPSSSLVLARCLNDAAAEPRYHCAMLEEFIDLYRDDPTRLDDIDNLYALPEELQGGMLTSGEDDLVRNVSLADAPELSLPASGSVDNVGERIARRNFGLDAGELVLSPSQMEAYIACPGKWFAQRRLGAKLPDEVLGPAQQGSFRHDVLQCFYELFRAEGMDKPRPESREASSGVLKRAFKQTLEEHLMRRRPGRRAPFLLDTTEERVLELIRTELGSWLGFEEQLLAPFQDEIGRTRRYLPRAFEFDIGEFGIEYAGVRLAGIIDRIDVDEATNSFVIVDYKGHVDANYDLALDGEGRPNIAHKIQALIYAHALLKCPEACQALGLRHDIASGQLPHMAGALYVSYLKGHPMRGVCVQGELSPEVLPTLPAGNVPIEDESVVPLLESIEAQVREHVVVPMLEGRAEPDPSDKDVCKWCSAYGCPRRS